MRWLLWMTPLLLTAADLKIDHVTVAGHDLKRIQAAIEAAGIPMVYGGAHANGVTEMALTSFPDGSYLEAIAVVQGADRQAVARHEWAAFLKHDAAACAWAIQSHDLEADRRTLAAAGLKLGDAVRAGRRRPDGVRLEWATADLGVGLRGGLFPFLIQDFTPRAQRAFPQGKPVTTAFQGLTRVVIAVKNLDAAVDQYRKAFHLPAVVQQVDEEFGARLATMGTAPVVLAQSLREGSWIDRRVRQLGEGPCAFVLGAVTPARQKPSAQSRWFGTQVSWLDADRLGWRLGVEPAK
jgi:hypothetical protein